MEKKLVYKILNEMAVYLGSYDVNISENEIEFNNLERDIYFTIKWDKYDEEYKVEVRKYSELTLSEINLIATIIKKLGE